MTTPLTLDEIERLLEKATPDEWRWRMNKAETLFLIETTAQMKHPTASICEMDIWDVSADKCCPTLAETKANAALIVALVADARARVAAGKAGGG